jgi:GNAT acetyltransferase-like protein
MSASVTLFGSRVCLRRWREEDREAFAAMNADGRVMEFFWNCLSRAESDVMVDHIQKHFTKHGFGLWALELPERGALHRVRGIVGARIQRPFHAMCGGRLASHARALGSGLCNGGGPIGAWLRLRDTRTLGSRVVHISRKPPLARRHGAAWNATRSRRRFRLSLVSCRSSAAKACPLPARFGIMFRRGLTSGFGEIRSGLRQLFAIGRASSGTAEAARERTTPFKPVSHIVCT